MAKLALRTPFEYVDCVGAEENTHQHVPQFYLVHPIEKQINYMVLIVREAMQVPDYKVKANGLTAWMGVVAQHLCGLWHLRRMVFSC